jgi:hypothetical protein
VYALLNRDIDEPFKIEDIVDEGFSKSDKKAKMQYPQYKEWISQHSEIADFVQIIMER